MNDIKSVIANATAQLKAASIESAVLDAQVLMQHVMGMNSAAILAFDDKQLSSPQLTEYHNFVQRRAAFEPIAYITGVKEFYGLEFMVKPGVLIPRPDSETLINVLLNKISNKSALLKIADLGVGSGALLLTALSQLPHAQGFGVDYNETPLQVTKHNAAALNLSNRTTLYQGSWAQPLAEKMDIIISNPPYISSAEMSELMADVKDYEPNEALEAGDDGLKDYRALIPSAYAKLKPNCWLIMEIGHTQALAVKQILEQQKQWQNIEIYQDLAARNRVVCAQRMA